MPFLPLVEMDKQWKGKTWEEIVQEYPASETKAVTFILAMFQGPETGKKHVLNPHRYLYCVLCVVCVCVCVCVSVWV
jgi:hypothetical protein